MIKKIAFIAPTESSFMRVDLEILNRIAPTHPIYLEQHRSRSRYLISSLKMAYNLLFDRQTDLVAIWFADYHAGLAVLASVLSGKRSIVFIGGYDAVKYPELRMGVYTSPIRAFFTRIALKNATLIIANHSALLDSDNLYYSPTGHPEGVYRMIPSLRTNSAVVFNALSIKQIPRLDLAREDRIITVGNSPRYQDFVNKGFDLLCECARLRPQWKFVFIGIRESWLDKLESEYALRSLTNVKIIPWIEQDKLVVLMETSKVYAQPSISEGMPNALMEAMYCGCIPVGSKVAGIPEVIGDKGYIFGKKDAYALLDCLDKAMISDMDRTSISGYVRDKFSIENRYNELQKLIRGLA